MEAHITGSESSILDCGAAQQIIDQPGGFLGFFFVVFAPGIGVGLAPSGSLGSPTQSRRRSVMMVLISRSPFCFKDPFVAPRDLGWGIHTISNRI